MKGGNIKNTVYMVGKKGKQDTKDDFHDRKVV